jgi:hypothetical protein
MDGVDFVLDPDGPTTQTQTQPPWMADGGNSWQRVAR